MYEQSKGAFLIRISDPRSVGTDESTLVVNVSVYLMHHHPDRSWFSDPDPDHPKGTHPKPGSEQRYA